ncbi:kin of IRRE-like protein 2 [Saccoglossus kowalevskii]
MYEQHVLTNIFIPVLLIVERTLCNDIIVTPPVDTIALLSYTAEMKCRLDETRSNTVFWEKDNTIIAINKIIENRFVRKYNIADGDLNYDLHIYDIGFDDEGVYECKHSGQSPNAYMYVLDKKTQCATNNAVAISGEIVHFSCNIGLPNNAPGDLVWYIDDTEYYRSNFSISAWTTSLNRSHNGAEFVCQLEHTTISSSLWNLTACEDKIELSIEYGPIVSINDNSNGRVIEGDTYTARCTVDANPTATIQWDNNNWESNSSDADLVLFDVERRHEGTYTCRATNMLYNNETRNDSKAVFLSVEFEPELMAVI